MHRRLGQPAKLSLDQSNSSQMLNLFEMIRHDDSRVSDHPEAVSTQLRELASQAGALHQQPTDQLALAPGLQVRTAALEQQVGNLRSYFDPLAKTVEKSAARRSGLFSRRNMDSLKQSSALTDRLLQSRQHNTASKQSQRNVCYHCRQLTKQVEDKLEL